MKCAPQEQQLGMFPLFDDEVLKEINSEKIETYQDIIVREKAELLEKTVVKLMDYTIGVSPTLLEPITIPYESLFPGYNATTDNVLLSNNDNCVRVQKNLWLIRKILTDRLGEDIVNAFKLKTDGDKPMRQLIPISGGADSSGIALVLRALFPNENFIFVFTDTMAESPDLYYQLDKIEEYLGVHINRITPEHGLYQLIDQKNGFAPSQLHRYCTPDLKIKPMLKIMEDSFNTDIESICNYVGIRFDEDRVGLVSSDDGIHTEMPYFDLQMGKTDVFHLLMATVGIPDFYSYKTRSGCIGCFFMRRSEKSAQLYHKPDEFHFVSAKEKLTANDRAKYGLHWDDNYRKAIYDPAISLGFTNKQQLYVVPDFVDTRTRGTDMFGLIPEANKLRERIFVGVAMYTPKNNYGCDNHLVYNTEFAVYSNRKHNLEGQMITWYEHQIENFSLKGFDSKDEMESDINLICFEVELPTDLGQALKSKTDDKSFTNSRGEAYMQIESITKLMHTVLTYERTLQDFEMYKKHMPSGDFEVFDLEYMQNLAYHLDKDLKHQKKVMDLLGNPSFIAHHIDTPTEDELFERMLKKKSKKNNKDKEAIEICVACSL